MHGRDLLFLVRNVTGVAFSRRLGFGITPEREETELCALVGSHVGVEGARGGGDAIQATMFVLSR